MSSFCKVTGIFFLLACQPLVGRFSSVAPTAPALTVDTLAPPIAAPGTVVTIEFSAAVALTDCKASLAGQVATCNSGSAEQCTCTAQVSTSTPQGVVTVTMSATGASGIVGTTTATAIVDSLGPNIDATRLAIGRTPSGVQDQAQIGANALVEPPPSYPGQGIASLSLWSAASGGTAVASLSPVDATTPITLPFGSGTQSFPELWISATDVAGNSSARIAITAGIDTTPPTIDASKLHLDLEPLGTSDAISADAAAISDNDGAVVAVNVSLDSAGATALAIPALASDGSFASTPLSAQGATRVYVTASDKAGNIAVPVYPRNVHARVNLAGRQRFDNKPTTMAMYPLTFDSTLSPPWPGEPQLAALEASDSDNAKAAASDGVYAEVPRPTPYSQSSPNWVSVSHTPPARFETTMTYDPFRQRAILFGGTTYASSPTTLLNDTYEFNATSWSSIATQHSPSPRSGAQIAYDAGIGTTVLFGGRASLANPGTCSSITGFCNDTWLYDGNDWTQLVTLHSPPARTDHAMAYDPFHDQLILFGGQSDVDNCGGSTTSLFLCNDTWSFDGSDWQQLAVSTSPTPRFSAAAAYDAQAPGVVLVGGQDSAGDHQCESTCADCECTGVWLFNGENWVLKSRLDGSANTLVLNSEPALGYDSSADQLLLYYPGFDEICTASGDLNFYCTSPPIITGGNDGSDPVMVYQAADRSLLSFMSQLDSPMAQTLSSPTIDPFFSGYMFSILLDRQALPTNIELNFAGAGAEPGPPFTDCWTELDFWNYAGYAWSNTVASTACAQATPLLPNYTSDNIITDYISDGKIWILGFDDGENGTRGFYTDYVELVVDYTLP